MAGTTPVRGGGRVLRVGTVLYAAFALVALLAWWTVGDTGWTQPVNLTTFWWSLPAAPLLLLALATRHPRRAALLLLPALIWVWSYGSAFLPGRRPSASGESFRVVSFNTFVGSPDGSHVVDLVDATDPDVLVLQEVFPPREEELRLLLAERFPEIHVVQSPGVGGVAVFSVFPVVSVEPVAHAPDRSRGTAVVTIDFAGTAVQVVPVHLISPCPTCGTSALERLELEGAVRAAEMDAVITAIRPDVPAIVAGDFNSTERSRPYRRLTGMGFRDPQREVGNGMGFTWPNGGSLPAMLRIDWLLTKGLEPLTAAVGDGGPSDHRPLVVDLAIAE